MYIASVVVPAYKRLEILKLVLEGIRRQTAKDIEVIVADDGSPIETKKYLNELKGDFPFPLRHVWHEDIGFRLSRILNKAIAVAQSDYIIINGAHSIPHKEYVQAHLSMREKGCFLVGRGVWLSEKYAKNVTAQSISRGKLDSFSPSLVFDSIFGKTRYGEFSIYIKEGLLNDFIYWLRTRNGWSRRIHAGNFSAWRDDLIRINGLDEAFNAWGHEDTELYYRLLNAGFKPKPTANRTINYHYYHERGGSVTKPENLTIFKATLDSGRDRCEHGLDQHLNGGSKILFAQKQATRNLGDKIA